MERYFLIFYTGTVLNGQKIGQVAQKGVSYPNLNETIAYLKENDSDVKEFILTNIVELNKKDFNAFVA